ncbi:MAG TPA: PBP1A family penicillin-binding protein [Longimicrobiaceae bacterium]|nr:PBP1A family penicillin-binding protein [Longimicrobiaceae bacterium]
MKLNLNAAAWRERARDAWPRLRSAWRDRQERKILIAFSALGLASCGTGAVAAAWTRACVGTCPTAEQIADFAPQQASQVLDAQGGLLGTFYRERRTVVPLRTLPRYAPMAFVAVEDQRFFEHEGVDPIRMIGAVRDNIVEGWGGPGGSTITMQLARNLFPQQLPAGEKTVRRKVAEIKLALDMEGTYSKERILEMYLNTIYLGAGAYGIEAASRTYFGKPATRLTYVEAATLAALPKAPSYYNPRRNPEPARGRRNLVLDFMAETGVITAAQAEAGKREPLVLAPPSGAIRAPYFVERVRDELEDKFGELLYTGGLRIHTGIDPRLQTAAEKSLEQHLEEIENGKFGPFPHPTYQKFTAGLAEDEEVTHTPYLQGLVVVMDPATGAIRAMVGGRDFSQSQFNRATQAVRQPGSAFKPFVYAAALEKGRSPLYSVSDGPFSLAMSDGSVWAPKNYDGRYGGYTTLRAGLRNSRNMVAIRLGREVGIAAVRDVAKRTGIRSRIPGYPSAYLGSVGVYPLDLISAYAPFANGGYRVEPRYVLRVEDNRGRLLWEPPQYPRRAVDPAVSWILTDMLREVVDRGTGWNARNPAEGNLSYDIPAAGKTGTTNESSDVWFVGYTPDLVAGVWVGLDNPRTIIRGATGGAIAVPVWARVMRTAYEGRKPPAEWPRPPGVVSRKVSGGRVLTDDCPWGGGYTDYFAARFAPEASCQAPRALPDLMVDPTPHLPGRPVFPGQARVPRPEDIVTTPKPQERSDR